MAATSRQTGFLFLRGDLVLTYRQQAYFAESLFLSFTKNLIRIVQRHLFGFGFVAVKVQYVLFLIQE